MDHAIRSLEGHLESSLILLKEEWKSGEYKKLSDCPFYGACKALVDAIRVLEKYQYGEPRTSSVKELLEIWDV